MEEPIEIVSKKILKNLQKLEKYTSQEKLGDGELDKIRKLLVETAESSYELISEEMTDIALQILTLLEFLDKVSRVLLEIQSLQETRRSSLAICGLLQYGCLCPGVERSNSEMGQLLRQVNTWRKV